MEKQPQCKPILAKMIIQQCLKAKLMVKPGECEEYVDIGRGIVVFVCFMQNATTKTVQQIIDIIINIKLSKNDDQNLVSVMDLKGEILIVPQATLGGKLKGKRMQYHKNIDKTQGLVLYNELIEGLNKIAHEIVIIKHGTYGNLQVLDINTNGPYTHCIDIT